VTTPSATAAPDGPNGRRQRTLATCEATRLPKRAGVPPLLRAASSPSGFYISCRGSCQSACGALRRCAGGGVSIRLASRLKREGISGVTLIRGEPGDPSSHWPLRRTGGAIKNAQPATYARRAH